MLTITTLLTIGLAAAAWRARTPQRARVRARR